MTSPLQRLETEGGPASDWKPYPAYKDCGVEWLGKVPGHWDRRRGKALFIRVQRPTRRDDEIVTCFRDGTVTLRKNRRVAGFTNALKEIGYQGVRKGDLVIHVMDAFAGAVGVSDSDGKSTPVYSVCMPRDGVHPRYYAFLIREMARAGFIQALAKGIRERSTDFRYETFGALAYPLPPPSEQAAIVRFLDHYDRLIRNYIQTKQKLIALLTEQKQAIIQHAVTRGLNPDVKLKPSGVDWLGDIPEHWKVFRLRSLLARVTSGSRGWSMYATDTGPLFLRITNLARMSLRIDLKDELRLMLEPEAIREGERTRVHPGDVLLSITAYIGSVAVVPDEFEEAYVSQHVACCRLRPGSAQPRWIGYVLLSPIGQTHGALCMYGGTKQGLSLDDVKNYIVLLPPHNEQSELVQWIESETSLVDVAITRAHRQITLMREYRTRLIADVVTGKIDVRKAAAVLPEVLPDEVVEVAGLAEEVVEEVEA